MKDFKTQHFVLYLLFSFKFNVVHAAKWIDPQDNGHTGLNICMILNVGIFHLQRDIDTGGYRGKEHGPYCHS